MCPICRLIYWASESSLFMFVMPWLSPLNITKKDRRDRVEISTPGVGRMVKEGDKGGVAKILLSGISTHCDSPQVFNVFKIQQCGYPSIMFSPAEENACSARWIDSWEVVLTFELVDHIVLHSLPADVRWGLFVTHSFEKWMRDKRTPTDVCGEAM